MKHFYTTILLAAALSACTAESLPKPDDTLQATMSYTITVSATKSATKALSLDGKTLHASWAVGEEVSVYSVSGEGDFEMESINPVGTLSAQSSGVTTTLSGSFIPDFTPTEGKKLRLKFCSDSYNSQKGTLEYIAANCDYAIADVTIGTIGAEGEVTTTPATFVNQQAIVKFSLKTQDGTETVEATSLTVNVGGRIYAITPDEAIHDICVAIAGASNKTVTLKATSADGDFSYEKTGISFENGKYYAIGIKMTRIPTLGDLYYSDGTFSTRLEAGKTPIGVIAYVGTDAFSENGVTLRDGTTTLESHGLVLCLKNIYPVMWRRQAVEINVIDLPENLIVQSIEDLFRDTAVSGYANTKTLIEKTADPATDFPAAYQTWYYSGLPTPANSTGWFMPSIQQWVKILTELGRMNESDIAWKDWIDPNLTTLHNLESAMNKEGVEFDDFTGTNRIYWASNETTAGFGTCIYVYPEADYNQKGMIITHAEKWSAWSYVRPVLAF